MSADVSNGEIFYQDMFVSLVYQFGNVLKKRIFKFLYIIHNALLLYIAQQFFQFSHSIADAWVMLLDCSHPRGCKVWRRSGVIGPIF